MAQTRNQELKIKRREIVDRLRTVENQISALSTGLTSDMVDVETVRPSPDELKRLEVRKQRLIVERNAVDRELEDLAERIRRLRFWLTIEAVGGISVIVLYRVFLYATPSVGGADPFARLYWYALPFILAAVAFFPFLLLTLLRAKQFLWIWIFIVVVILPALFNSLPIEDKYLTPAIRLFPLLTFYVYCGVLRWIVDDWLEY